MKVIYHILATLSLLLVGCSREYIPTQDGTIVLDLRMGSEVNTRSTNLISSDNRQHAKYVQLYVFDNTGLCVQSHNINWKQTIGGLAKQTYTLKGLTQGEMYTLLAVGLDEIPTESNTTTYGLPEAVLVNTTTLADLKASLAVGKTQENIATSELFSGWESVTAGVTSGVSINLFRRVAGVLAYIKDIPANVATIQLILHKNQYVNVPLQKKGKANKYENSDHGDIEMTNSQILMSISVNNTILNQTEVLDGHGFKVSKQVGTVLQGAYLLPLEAPSTGNTLNLVTLDALGNLLRTYQVKILTATENGGVTTEKLIKNYPFYANQFYSIGKRNLSEGIDEPLSLGNDDVVIIVNPNWENSYDIPLN